MDQQQMHLLITINMFADIMVPAPTQAEAIEITKAMIADGHIVVKTDEVTLDTPDTIDCNEFYTEDVEIGVVENLVEELEGGAETEKEEE